MAASGPLQAQNETTDAGETPLLTKREVAASFLFRFAPDDARKVQVALFRRSGEVRTYQHKLAPISGSVDKEDANALATALREIREETTLDLTSMEILCQGKPYSFVDDAIGREWTVHPFAFRLKSTEEGGKGEAGIAIDWEHEGWEWHDPLAAAATFGGGGGAWVPRLLDSLRRVWPEIDLGAQAGAALTRGLHHLRTDHESGARQLATKAVSILREVIFAATRPDNDDEDDASAAAPEDDNHHVVVWWANIRMAAWHLWKNGRESMGAAIGSALVSALDRIEQGALEKTGGGGGPPGHKLLPRVLSVLDDYLAQRESTVSKIQASFAGLIKDRILLPLSSSSEEPQNNKQRLKVLTLSSSSTISSCLLQAATALGVTLDLRILESRPLCEGVTLASNLLLHLLPHSEEEAGGDDDEEQQQQRLGITLYSDASAALASEGADLVLLGADRISAAGHVSNKTGSLPAVLSARHVAPGARVVVLSEVDKIAGPGEARDHAVEENDAEELTRGWQGVVKGADVVGTHSTKQNPGRGTTQVKVKNIYFEWVPARFIDAYVTDEGVWSADEIRMRSEWIGAEMERFFGDL